MVAVRFDFTGFIDASTSRYIIYPRPCSCFFSLFHSLLVFVYQLPDSCRVERHKSCVTQAGVFCYTFCHHMSFGTMNPFQGLTHLQWAFFGRASCWWFQLWRSWLDVNCGPKVLDQIVRRTVIDEIHYHKFVRWVKTSCLDGKTSFSCWRWLRKILSSPRYRWHTVCCTVWIGFSSN